MFCEKEKILEHNNDMKIHNLFLSLQKDLNVEFGLASDRFLANGILGVPKPLYRVCPFL